MNRPAVLSFGGLVSIQVTIGLVYSFAGKQGTYAFSQASALCIAEFLKFLISSGLFWLEIRKDYAPLSQKEDFINDIEKGEAEHSIFNGLLHRANTEIPHRIKAGFAVLACLYAINNHLSFLLFLIADSGTISLVKSGSTFSTALVLLLLTGQNQALRQWSAITLQVVGLIVTQTDFKALLGSFTENARKSTTLHPISSYIMLLVSACITAVSSVCNERLCKTKVKDSKMSLNAQNMFLYSAGACINLAIYLMKRYLLVTSGPDEPFFFSGYGSFAAIMVILSNTLIGLAITTVYKYANAVIKCLAMAFATGILLTISSCLFNTQLPITTLPGTVLIFAGTYIYVTHVPPKSAASESQISAESSTTDPISFGQTALLFFMAFGATLLTVCYLTYFQELHGSVSVN